MVVDHVDIRMEHDIWAGYIETSVNPTAVVRLNAAAVKVAIVLANRYTTNPLTSG